MSNYSCVILSLWSDRLVSVALIVEAYAAKVSNDSTEDQMDSKEPLSRAAGSQVTFFLGFSRTCTSSSVDRDDAGSSTKLLQMLAPWFLPPSFPAF